jgi:signal transduction histidine kinase/ActR/RegA family two-component response regulator
VKPISKLSYRTRSIFLIALMAIVMVVIIFNSYKIYSIASSNAKNASAYLQNLNRLERFTNLLIDAETGERGYVITKNEEFLQPYNEAVRKLRQSFPPDSLLRYMPEYTAEIGNINTLVAEQLTHLNSVITRVKNGETNNISTLEATEGKNTMDAIRSSVQVIYDREAAKLAQVNEENVSQNQNVFIILIAGTVLGILLLFGYFILITNNTKLQSKLSEELNVAKNRVSEASKSKSRFLSTMSHELRTPMNGVLGMTSLLMQTPLNEEQKKYANTIHRSGVELLAVINDLIDFSKIENGTVSLEVSSFRLQELIDEVINLLAPDRNNITINSSIASNVPAGIVTDQARLRQILINVIANVLKISGQSSVDVRVRCKLCDEETTDIIFEVVASGSKVQENATANGNGFSRLDISAGLGLSISTRLISLLGGSIKLDTNAKQGSTIQFSVKAKSVRSEQHLRTVQSPSVLDSELQKKYPLRILSVDDNDMNQTVLTSILGKLGYEAETASNGQVAYDMSVENEYDVIFMDMLMPVMDGVEATRRIRQYHIHKELPIIIGITADSIMNEKNKWEQSGMNDFLTKPYKAAEIQNLIIKWGTKIASTKNPA